MVDGGKTKGLLPLARDSRSSGVLLSDKWPETKNENESFQYPNISRGRTWRKYGSGNLKQSCAARFWILTPLLLSESENDTCVRIW